MANHSTTGRRAVVGAAAAVSAGVVAATSVVLAQGGPTKAADGARGLASEQRTLVVRVERPEGAAASTSTRVPTAAPLGGVAVWDEQDRTLRYVSGRRYSGSCLPQGQVTWLADGGLAVSLRDADGLRACPADAVRAQVIVEGLTGPPTELMVGEPSSWRTVEVTRRDR